MGTLKWAHWVGTQTRQVGLATKWAYKSGYTRVGTLEWAHVGLITKWAHKSGHTRVGTQGVSTLEGAHRNGYGKIHWRMITKVGLYYKLGTQAWANKGGHTRAGTQSGHQVGYHAPWALGYM